MKCYVIDCYTCWSTGALLNFAYGVTFSSCHHSLLEEIIKASSLQPCLYFESTRTSVRMLAQLFQLAGISKRWPTFTREEIARHNTPSSLWIVAGNSVYDVTNIVDRHPGGAGALLKRGGGMGDCTRDFRFHSSSARQQAETCKIGVIGSIADPSASFSPSIKCEPSVDSLSTSKNAGGGKPERCPHSVMIDGTNGSTEKCTCSLPCHSSSGISTSLDGDFLRLDPS